MAGGGLRRFVRPSDEDTRAMADTLITACSRGRAWNTSEQAQAWGPLLEASEAVRKAAVYELVRRIRERVRGLRFEHDEVGAVYVWHDLLRALLPCQLSWGPTAEPILWSPVELAAVIHEISSALDEAQIEARWYAAGELVQIAARNNPAEPRLRDALIALAGALHRNAHDRDTHAGHRKLGEQIAAILGIEDLHGPDAWRRVLLPDDHLTTQLLALAAKAPAKPSPRFAARAETLLEHLGRHDCRERLLAWLPALAGAKADEDEPSVVPAETATLMIGLAHIADAYDDAAMLAGIADLGIAGYRKIPHFGALSAKLGTACARLLAARPDALGQLARMHQRTAHPPSRAKVAKLLDEVAARLRVSADELTEIVIDDLGLSSDGRARESFDNGTWELLVGDEIITRWHVDGRTTKSPPAALRTTNPELVKDVTARTKAVRDALGVQRTRLENLLREDREWPVTTWLVRYIEHGLVGALARRLVWRLADAHGEQTVLWRDGHLVGLDGAALSIGSDDARMRLWHPAGAPPGEREELRTALAAAGIQQPFDQVERHVFAPEPDDHGATGVRRYATTRVRQHQLAAILKGRGWRYELRSAWFDSSDHPRLELPAWGMSAVLVLRDEDPEESAASERGILLEVELVEVRFLAGESHLDPHDVPLVAFSEVLRDVALIVRAAETTAPTD